MKNSYQKKKIGGLLRSILDLFRTFCCQKRPVSWLKVLWTNSTTNSSENTTENSIKTVHKLQLQFNQFNQFISSVCFVSLLLFIVWEKKIERGALQFVIKPFLYCDLFKASARAKKEKKNIFVSFSLDGFDHKSLQIVRTQIHSLKLSNSHG